MSFVARHNLRGEDDHCSSSLLHQDDNANQHEESQSTHAELPAEIPDSQPDPYLPAEIPDSQPDLVYHADLPFGDPDYSEVSSQLPTRGHGDLQLGHASAFDPGDYDLGEEEAIDPGDRKLEGQEEFNSRVNRFDRFYREEVDESVNDEALSSSSSGDTEIIPGGTRLTERLNNRLVSFFRHSPIPSSLLSVFFESSRPQHLLCHLSSLNRHLFSLMSVNTADFKWPRS